VRAGIGDTRDGFHSELRFAPNDPVFDDSLWRPQGLAPFSPCVAPCAAHRRRCTRSGSIALGVRAPTAETPVPDGRPRTVHEEGIPGRNTGRNLCDGAHKATVDDVPRLYPPRGTLMNDHHGLFLITSRLCATGDRSMAVWVIR
jgi:hypothetical protein